jgi:hypothetical protein
LVYSDPLDIFGNVGASDPLAIGTSASDQLREYARRIDP